MATKTIPSPVTSIGPNGMKEAAYPVGRSIKRSTFLLSRVNLVDSWINLARDLKTGIRRTRVECLDKDQRYSWHVPYQGQDVAYGAANIEGTRDEFFELMETDDSNTGVFGLPSEPFNPREVQIYIETPRGKSD